MFEETRLVHNIEDSPRKRACFNQCRLQKYYTGGSINDGNCPCDGPKECRFNLPDHRSDEDTIGLMFEDIRNFYRQLASE